MDTRKFKRVKSDIVAWFEVMDTNETVFGRPKVGDVSAGGIRLEMSECRKEGDLMKLKFNLPGSDNEINAIGKVQWCHELESGVFDLGIEFVEIASCDMDAINNYAGD